jgi:hypothetical protein
LTRQNKSEIVLNMKTVTDEFYNSALELAQYIQDQDLEWENFETFVVIDGSMDRKDHILHHAAEVGGFSDSLDEMFDDRSGFDTRDPQVKKFLGRNPHCLKGLDPDEYGVWEVRGEDPNPDMNGHHYNHHLFTAEGALKYVVKKAVNTSGFWAWGRGGEIKKIEIEKV